MSKDRIFELCDVVRETGYALHRYLGPGYLEKVYENGLPHRLTKVGLHVQAQFPLRVCDEDGAELGDYFADLFVEGQLIVELKAARSISDEHVAQLLGYLRASSLEHGLLMNFGAARFEVKKYVMSPSNRRSGSLPAFLLLLFLFASFCVFCGHASAAPPGVVVDYSPAASRQYIGSPGLAVLPSGTYVASHDFFGPGSTRDRTVVFESTDRGKTWTKLTEIVGQWWSSLFVHNGGLYLMGTSREYGFCVIRRSTDGGRTWTTPADRNSGLLHGDGKYHCAPVPVLVHNGRLWRAMEDAQGPGGWGHHFRAFMMSAPVDADLLRAESWTSSNRIGRDPAWLDGHFGGWLEGNAVLAPDGGVVNILRVDDKRPDEKAAVIRVSADGKTATFDPKADFVPFPGGAKKFTIRWDPAAKCYWSLANYVPPEHRNPRPASTRNTLALIRSTDLRTWEVRAVLIRHPDREKHGFQYVDWLFDGDDMIALVRTGHEDGVGGAHNQHDANYLTFHRFAGFRTLTSR